MSDDFFAAHFAPLPLMTILRGYGTAETVELAERSWDVGAVSYTHLTLPTNREV